MSNLAGINNRWRYRRCIVVATLVFCAAGIAWLTLWGSETRLNETLAFGYFGLGGTTIGTYVFGAVWDDINLVPEGRRKDRREDPSS